MSRPQAPHDLQIFEDMEFQRRNWRVERASWALLVLVLVAAVAGLFGPGLVGPRTAASPDKLLSAQYPQFWRMQRPMVVRVRFDPSLADRGQVRLWLDRAYLDTVTIHEITPPPESAATRSDRFDFVFAVSGAGGPCAVTFNLEPQKPGVLHGRAGLAGGPEVAFDQLIYP